MKIEYIIAFVLLLLVISCSNVNTEKVNIVHHAIVLTLPSQSKAYSTCIRYFVDSVTCAKYLALLNEDFNRIEIYNTSSGEIHKTIKYVKEGPNGVGSVRGFAIKNLDSILIFNTSAGGQFYLTDKEGQILNKYTISNSESTYPLMLKIPNSTFNHPVLFYKDNTVLLSTMILFPLNSTGELLRCKLLARINLINGQYKILNTSFPILQNKEGESVEPIYSFTSNNKGFFFSFANSHKIFFADTMAINDVKNVKSNYFMGDFISNCNQSQFNMKKFIEAPFYTNLYYFDKHKMFYRFFKHGDDFEGDRSFTEATKYPINFSLIVTDENFNILKEFLFPKDEYVINMTFMSEEGLYICSSNVNSVNFNENILTFDLFKYEK